MKKRNALIKILENLENCYEKNISQFVVHSKRQ